MKPIMIALFLCAGGAWAADEVADRAAIEKAVATLGAFTADFDGRAELARMAQSDPNPSVVISKEPWGEATVSIPGVQIMAAIATKKIRFLTAEWAMVDAQGKAPLLFILKKEGTDWKIASLRILAEK
jgi:hypothetical protein